MKHARMARAERLLFIAFDADRVNVSGWEADAAQLPIARFDCLNGIDNHTCLYGVFSAVFAVTPQDRADRISSNYLRGNKWVLVQSAGNREGSLLCKRLIIPHLLSGSFGLLIDTF
jgi:hypothetical protein